jgi:uncharacterized membrane protein
MFSTFGGAMSAPAPEAAKRPRTVLAGSYGHPIHPILVTIPIGTWTASLIFDIAALARDDGAAFAQGSHWLIGIGILGALLAAIWGSIDLSGIPRGTTAYRTGLTHMSLNLAVVALYVVNYFVRGDDTTVGTLPLILSIVGIVLLGAAGFLGGKLAYRFGVRVADEQTQADGFR